jgi:uncharacterized protein
MCYSRRKKQKRGFFMHNLSNPISEHERIRSIDAMRGFAILGIFLTNMIDFHSPMLYLNPQIWWSSKTDQTVYNLIDFFVQASFYPLFAMLFGFGLMTMRQNAISKGYAFLPIALRRLSLLLLIGCIHAFFIWHGDILTNYAVFGLIALLFLGLSGRSLFLTGVLTYFIPNLLLGLLLLLGTLVSPNSMSDFYKHDDAYQAVEAYQNGDFMEITAQRIYDWSQVNSIDNAVILFFTIFPFLLIGAGAAKLNWIRKVRQHQKRVIFLLVLLVITGGLLKFLPFAVRNIFSEYVQDIFGGPLFAISYALIIILLMEKYAIKLAYFQAVGKLAFSNYLFQSIVATLIFYNYGLGLYSKISVVTGTILAITIFIIQVYVSSIWVKNFHYGPMEWIWRAVSYWKKPRWKR